MQLEEGEIRDDAQSATERLLQEMSHDLPRYSLTPQGVKILRNLLLDIVSVLAGIYLDTYVLESIPSLVQQWTLLINKCKRVSPALSRALVQAQSVYDSDASGMSLLDLKPLEKAIDAVPNSKLDECHHRLQSCISESYKREGRERSLYSWRMFYPTLEIGDRIGVQVSEVSVVYTVLKDWDNKGIVVVDPNTRKPYRIGSSKIAWLL